MLQLHTTEPVNLVLHDYVLDAGEASQILPDNALDTSYVTFGWGIWDDPADTSSERNCNEFLITAAMDSTLVTISHAIHQYAEWVGAWCAGYGSARSRGVLYCESGYVRPSIRPIAFGIEDRFHETCQRYFWIDVWVCSSRRSIV